MAGHSGTWSGQSTLSKLLVLFVVDAFFLFVLFGIFRDGHLIYPESNELLVLEEVVGKTFRLTVVVAFFNIKL